MVRCSNKTCGRLVSVGVRRVFAADRIHKAGEVFTRPCFVPPVILVGDFLIACHLLYSDRPAGQGGELGEFFASLCFLFLLVLEWLKHKESQP